MNKAGREFVEVAFVCALGGSGSIRMYLDEVGKWLQARRQDGDPRLIIEIRSLGMFIEAGEIKS